MKISLDVFGGDNAPIEILKGAIAAKAEYDIELALCGSTVEMLRVAKDAGLSLEGLELIEAGSVIDMHDEAKAVLRQKADSSMAVALKMVADGKADAVVSAGSTGAFLMGATMIIKRIKGIKRPALGAIMPGTAGPYILVDCGANAEVRPEMLNQFGLMGSVYMKNVLKVNSPKVALANNGAEETKGTDLQRDAYLLLKNNKDVEFCGNVEGRDIPSGEYQVIVADGFSGNLILKTVEGTASFTFGMLKDMFTKNLFSKLGAVLLGSGLRELRQKMDYTEYGGAPLIGLKQPAVKAHGSSNANAIKNAIRQAMQWASSGVTEEIQKAVAGNEDDE
ncbi:MAG: phosphate acyltransferase PlsX [Oscillospiraceae bacterium]|nr:phosphate acyltransferase PlsX [Oscillospiraceae bacterium]